MSPSTSVPIVVVGAGHTGLVMSRLLAQAGREHLVLERRGRLGGAWLDRWDAFRLVSPNWTSSFPGQPYDGPDPDGFMPRDEIAARVAGYAETIKAPVTLDTEVTRLGVRDAGGFRLDTSRGSIEAEQVFVATGGFQRPHIPGFASDLPARLTQLHTHDYRRESSLPPGAVMVVGSGQSGVQIAEELSDARRRVYLSVGSTGRTPRTYRGRDIFRWFGALATEGPAYGLSLPTVDTLPDPRLRLAGNPQLSGHHGGHTVDLPAMAAAGLTLLGRIERVDGEHLTLAGDMTARLAGADTFFDTRIQPLIDTFIERAAVDAPPDDRPPMGPAPAELAALDLAAAGISTVIWATGYRLDFGWIGLPLFDEQGYPRHTRGLTDVPGLRFLGLHWQHSIASATLFGVSQDAHYLAERLDVPVRPPAPPSGGA